MTEYRWQWCKPDKPGIWAYGGATETEQPWPKQQRIVQMILTDECGEGWWCFLMPLPTIIPPKRKTVWRMWVEQYIPNDPFPSCYRPLWYPDGVEPNVLNAIRTDKTEEREE